MLMIRKYFWIQVISVVTSIICERTRSQVTYETCTIQDSYVTSDQRGAALTLWQSLFRLFKVSPLCPLVVEWWSGLVLSPHKKNVTTQLKQHHWGKNSISEKCNYLNFKCWKPALIIINYKFLIRIFLGSEIHRADCKVKSTFNLYFTL